MVIYDKKIHQNSDQLIHDADQAMYANKEMLYCQRKNIIARKIFLSQGEEYHNFAEKLINKNYQTFHFLLQFMQHQANA